jgi:hypothetical protein
MENLIIFSFPSNEKIRANYGIAFLFLPCFYSHFTPGNDRNGKPTGMRRHEADRGLEVDSVTIPPCTNFFSEGIAFRRNGARTI